MTTTARLLQANLRLWSLSRTDGHPWSPSNGKLGGDWPYRRDSFYRLLADKKVGRPSIIAFQETDDKYVLPGVIKVLQDQDGHPWQFLNRGKVGVAWNATKWSKLGGLAVDMDNGDAADRRCVAVRLQSVKTGGKLGVTSTHFGVHFNGADQERIEQAATVTGILKGMGFGPSDPFAVMGDFNDKLPGLALGVRRVFEQEGYHSIRQLLSDEDLVGNSFNTHHGYQKTTKRAGEWIDDVLLRACTPLTGQVVLTDGSSPFKWASDHNLIATRIRF